MASHQPRFLTNQKAKATFTKTEYMECSTMPQLNVEGPDIRHHRTTEWACWR